MALASDKSPVLLGKDCPAIPPGLEVSGDTLTIPSLLPTQVQPENNPSTTGIISSSPSDLSTPQQISSDPSPATPTSFGRQLFNTIRRAPSMPATRVNANSTDGNDNRKSLADKSPRPSLSAFAAVPESSHETPPPVPPLPPSVLASHPPMLPHVNEPRKEEKAKEKEKSRPGANWFKKRKSLKVGDKSIKQEDPSLQTTPSLVVSADDPGHSHSTGRLNRTRSSSSTPKSQWPPSEVDPDMSRKNTDRRLNGYDDSHSQPSGSSSPSTTSLFVSGQGAVGSASTNSTPHHDHPRNSSVTTPSERSRVSVDRDKSLDLKIPLHGGPPATSPTQNNLDHPLPPVPSPTRHLNEQPFSSHGYTEHEAGSTYRTESDTWLLDQQHVNSFLAPPPHVSRSSTLPPHPSLSITVGSNTSSDSNPAMGRHPIRKLSLSTPILGFGRKDREKNKR